MQPVILTVDVDEHLGATLHKSAVDALTHVRAELSRIYPTDTVPELPGNPADWADYSEKLQDLFPAYRFNIEQLGLPDTLKNLCRLFRGRANAQGLKGKRRDDALIEFMLGAWAALDAGGHPDANAVSIAITMCFCPRGYTELERILAHDA